MNGVRLGSLLALALALALGIAPAAADVATAAAPAGAASPIPSVAASPGSVAPAAPPSEGASAVPSGAPASPAASAAPLSGPQVGLPAPAFTLRTLDGKTVSLDTYKGKTLVINAWATWCPPCREEMPALMSAAPRLAKGNVAVLGVDTTEAAPIVRAYAVAKSVPYPLAAATDRAFEQAYDVQYFPTTFVIDPQGVLRARYVDVLTEPQLTAFVEAAKAGRDVVISSALQQKIDATLTDPSIVFGDDAGAVEANAKKAAAAIAKAEDDLDASDAGKENAIDFVRTRAEEAALRDKAIAALVNVGTSVNDKTLLTRLHADAAVDREDWREAAQAYEAVLAIAPQDRDALSGVALARSRLGDDGVAIDALEKLVALDPTEIGSYVELAHAQTKAGKKDDASATFVRAIAAAQRTLAADPHKAHSIRMLAYAYLYAGRSAAESGDRATARTDFDQTSRLAASLPANDERHDMYLEEAQEAIVALGLTAPNGLSVSLVPWTGPDLPGSLASTYKYRLAVAGDAGRNVSLVASNVPKHWVASFCSDSTCAPFRTSFALPPSGVKLVEFQLVPPGASGATPKVRVNGSDGKNEASATT
jgi:peroxiredoxin